MKRLLLLALLAPCAFAQECIEVTWQHPTSRVDGTPLNLSEIIDTEVLWGQEEGEWTHNTFIGAPAAETCVTPGYGTWYFVARTVDENMLVSDYSNVAVATRHAVPESPSDLVTAREEVVYTIVQSRDRIAVVSVGTVPAGTPCLTEQGGANGRYVVPRDSVTWFGSVRPEVVVAACSPD